MCDDKTLNSDQRPHSLWSVIYSNVFLLQKCLHGSRQSVHSYNKNYTDKTLKMASNENILVTFLCIFHSYFEDTLAPLMFSWTDQMNSADLCAALGGEQDEQRL